MEGYSYRFLGDYEAAEKAFRKYIELVPDDANPYDSYADLMLKLGRYQESIEYYRKALEVNPGFAPSMVGIATNLNFLGRHAEAREELLHLYNRAIDEGQRRTALFATAVSYADEGDLDSALVVLQQMYAMSSAAKDPASRAADLGNMGVVLLQADRPAQAADKFEESLKVIENSDLFSRVKENARLDYINFLARVALVRGDLKRADSLATDYLDKVEPINNPFRIRTAHLTLGMIALKRGRFENAIDHLKKADQQQAYTIFQLAKAYEASGDRDKALQMYKRAAEFDQLNSLLYAFIRESAKEKVQQLSQT
jgi:tetratricopeptide (TPR) repeat protein